MEPTFKTELTHTEKIDFNKYQGRMLVIIKKLKDTKNFNKDYKKETERIYEVCNYSNWCFQSFMRLKFFLETKELPKLDKQTELDLTKNDLRNLYDVSSIHSALICYKIIELSFKAILKSVKYELRGKKHTVDGKETLGQIKSILSFLLPEERFFWDKIDIDFRNSLAHGRYLVKNHKFIYYTKPDFSDPKELTKEELRKKVFSLSMMALIIASTVGDWIDLEKFNVGPECDLYYTQ